MTTAAMKTKNTTVVLADDHTLIREGLKRLLDESDGIEVVGVAQDGPEALRQVREHAPDVLVLDLSMPGQSGVQVARKMRTQHPDTRVVVLTVHEQEDYVSDAFKAGVRGYVLKDSSAEELVEAIRTVTRDEVYMSPTVSRLVSFEGGDPRRIRTVSQKLTAREREVCRYLAQGYTVPEIASILGISRKTVDVHKTRLMRKLGVHNRADLVTHAMKNKLA
jgi:two-component system response regulator NreC